MKDWTEHIELDELPGDLRIVAEVLGIEQAVKLAEHLGGGTVYIPKAESAITGAKQRFILDNPEMTIPQLRRATGYSDRQIIRIRQGSATDDRQTSFLTD